jgi:hypothetical protein
METEGANNNKKEEEGSSRSVDPLLSILECPLCLNMVCEPISISCGHTFCRVCLVKSLRRHKKRCPSCREICHIAPETAAENVMVKGLAMTLDSQGYRLRLEETAAEKESWSTILPIFFYNSAMFPGSTLSLHLFEPRYKVMMQRVVNGSKSFAYVPNFSSYQANSGDIALIAKLKEVEFLPGKERGFLYYFNIFLIFYSFHFFCVVQMEDVCWKRFYKEDKELPKLSVRNMISSKRKKSLLLLFFFSFFCY